MPDASTTPWAALLPAALAGTRRQPFAPVPGLTPALGTEAAAPEKQLLLTAANLTLVQQAGRRPPTGPAQALPPCPPETRPAAPEAAFHRLEALLAGFPAESLKAGHCPQQYTLQALLADLQRLGRRLPPRVALRLLRYRFSYDSYAAPLTRRVLGERGSWLHEVLGTGHSPWFSHVLSTLRQEPGHYHHTLRSRLTRPMAADESYLAEFAQQPAQAQAQLLWWTWEHDGGLHLPAPLQQKLDELLAATPPARRPWPDELRQLHERAMGHPRLAGHPGLARLAEAADQLLTLERPAGQPPRVCIRLPTAWREEWQELGLYDTPNYFRRRNGRETWLQEIAMFLGPHHWADRWQLPPAEVVALTAAAERGDLVLAAWSFSLNDNTLHPSLYHSGTGFARALLATGRATGSAYLRAGLAAYLPPAEQAAALASLQPAELAAPHAPDWEWLLNSTAHLLGQPHLLRQLLPTLAAALALPRPAGAGLDKLLDALAWKPLDPTLYPEVQAVLGSVASSYPRWARALNLLLHGLGLRCDVQQASQPQVAPAPASIT